LSPEVAGLSRDVVCEPREVVGLSRDVGCERRGVVCEPRDVGDKPAKAAHNCYQEICARNPSSVSPYTVKFVARRTLSLEDIRQPLEHVRKRRPDGRTARRPLISA
jgi:hypothetical protein